MVWHEPFQILNPWQTIQNLPAGFFMAKLVQWSFPSLVHQVHQVHQVNLTDSEWKRPDDNQRTGRSWLHLASKSTESTVQSQCSDVAARCVTVRFKEHCCGVRLCIPDHAACTLAISGHLSRACQSLTALPISTHAVCLEWYSSGSNHVWVQLQHLSRI